MEMNEAELKRRYMDEYLHVAAREGNENFLDEIQTSTGEETENGEGRHSERYFLTQTPEGDNLLHVAASHDKLGFIVKALKKVPPLVLLICWTNTRGENPLHVAARLGHLDIVQVLVTSYKAHLQEVKEGKVKAGSTLLSLMVAEEGTASPEPWLAQDSRGNTPLHEALKNGYEEVAIYLLEVEPQLASYENNADESVLFLAAAYGHENVLEMVLNSEVSYSLSAPVGLTPLHAVIHNCAESSAKLLLEKQPQLAQKADYHKRTALFYAAEANKHSHVETILKTDKSCAFLRDDTGLTPLLRAASLGQLQAVRAILLYCPESVTICDKNGKTALHVVELKEYADGVELLQIPALERLINEQDLDGNTPLHLAAMNSSYVKANVVIDSEKGDLNIRNKEGFTAWDLIKLQPELSEQMAETGYRLVMHASKKQMYSETQPQPQAHSQPQPQPQAIHQTNTHPLETHERMQRKFNTLGLIATVLAAVTFAVGFAIPGGFDRRGHAVLAGESEFKVFLLSNTTAMCGYTFVFFGSLWAMMIAQRDDEPRFLLSFIIRILQLSFYATLVAFVSGMYALTFTKSLWLAIVVVCLPPSVAILSSSKFIVFLLARFFSKQRVY